MARRSDPRLLLLALVLGLCSHVAAYDLDLDSSDSIKSTASQIAFDMMSYYKGNLSGQTPGILPGPPPNPTITNAGYFWWEAGGMWGALMDYWYYTGDDTYNDVVQQGMLFQTGPNNDYLPPNQTSGMGNDDQAFWGMSAMTAAELNFTNPAPNQPQWLSLAIAVYNTQYVRIDNVCGGGLRWQAYPFLNGYNYKNSIANGGFFNIASRLALYTGNASYATSAETIWDWITSVGFIDENYNVYDGADTGGNCTVINKEQFSYNAGVFVLGAATMYNYTNGSSVWEQRLTGLLNATIGTFFEPHGGIAFEVTCETALTTCTIDMLSLKAYLTRWLAASTKLAPFITDQVMALLRTSAAAAAAQCDGSPSAYPNGRMCGMSWYKNSTWDGTSGVGQQMAALQVIQANMISQAKEPLTSTSGGTSKGDPSAGSSDSAGENPTVAAPPTTKDKAGAGILTAVVAIVVLGGLGWVSW